MISKQITIRISNWNLAAEEAALQLTVVKTWATLESGTEILKITSDFIETQSSTH